jgi:hypothetical protein
MADTQEAPSLPQGRIAPSESIEAAHNAFLGILESDEEPPKEEEAQPTEEEESEIDESSDEEPESETEEAEEEESDEEESEEDEEEEPRELGDDDILLYKGEEYNIDDLVKGGLRHADYTRKTQALAEQRKQTEDASAHYSSEVAQIQAERNYYVQSLQHLIDGSMGEVDKFANINWEQLKAEDPLEYVSMKDEFRDRQERYRSIQHEQQQANGRQQAVLEQGYAQTLAEEGEKLAESLPEWRDPGSRQKLVSKLRSYATDQGFTEEELTSLSDSRSVMVLLKAQKYDELQKTDVKSKKLRNKPRVVRSGSPERKSDGAKSRRKSDMKRLRETGSVKDAVSLFEDFVDF